MSAFVSESQINREYPLISGSPLNISVLQYGAAEATLPGVQLSTSHIEKGVANETRREEKTGRVSEPKHGRVRFDAPCYCPLVETCRMKRADSPCWVPATSNDTINDISSASLTWLAFERVICQKISTKRIV